MRILKRTENGATLPVHKRRRFGPKARQTALILSEAAAAYFCENGRAFPWRVESDPFRLAVAEILLQKTRAQSIVTIYHTILTRYPTASALSEASVDCLESILRPVGLSNRRANQLVGMARVTQARGAMIFDDWRSLLAFVPGIGEYAARAIVCFGRGEHVGIVDANVARILRRVFRIRTRDSRAVVYQQYADEIALASADPRATNFGLLDIGAAVCHARPACEECPFVLFCPRFGVGSTRR